MPALPKFNTSAPAAREFLFGVAEYWVNFGIDGWRLDVPSEIDDDSFWQEFRRRVRAINSEAYLVGELWSDARRWLQGDQFDGCMNYQVTAALLSFLTGTHLDLEETLRAGGYRGQVQPIDANDIRRPTGCLPGHVFARGHSESSSTCWTATTRRVS